MLLVILIKYIVVNEMKKIILLIGLLVLLTGCNNCSDGYFDELNSTLKTQCGDNVCSKLNMSYGSSWHMEEAKVECCKEGACIQVDYSTQIEGCDHLFDLMIKKLQCEGDIFKRWN